MSTINTKDGIEQRRCALQKELDTKKTALQRNKLGQFATPTQLARDVLAFGLDLLPRGEEIRFLDPAIGTGSFYSALLATAKNHSIFWAKGFEIDSHYGIPCQALWAKEALQVTLADFTRQQPPQAASEKSNLLICNPPYVRHHHIDSTEKARLKEKVEAEAGLQLTGLSGLYCYFMALAHKWMSQGGIAGWLIPSEFMDVNYGRALKTYLLRDVTLLQVHRFDPNDVQFDDALVSSAVVWIKNEPASLEHEVIFSYGGSLQRPQTSKNISIKDLDPKGKWTRFPREKSAVPEEGYTLGDLFSIKRGLATGGNSFFIIEEEHAKSLGLPRKYLRPILPSARYIKQDEITADADGIPLLEKRLLLLDSDEPEEILKKDAPKLWEYLQTGLEDVAQGYLCRSRRLWYSQEKRPAAPIVCTYMGRSDHAGKPFRFLLNNSNATATNGYLCLYPKEPLAACIKGNPDLMRKIWKALNNIDEETLLNNGRVYGGGMHKLEPKELANVPANHLAALAGLPDTCCSAKN